MKQYTDKQANWRKRNAILWRLKGIGGFHFEEGIVTDVEVEKLSKALELIREVVADSTESSIQLGFNAKKRCEYTGCGRCAVENSSYCSKHKRLMEVYYGREGNNS